jgi:hypothetical protein
MNLNQSSLVLFESERKRNNYIPPEGSNSFYNIGEGQINIKCERSDPNNYRFDLFTSRGTIYTGPGNFVISGDIGNIEFPYKNFTIIQDTAVKVNNILTISNGIMEVYGKLELMSGSQLIVRDKGKIIFYPDSELIIHNDSDISVAPESNISIYGKINVHLSKVDSILNIYGITIDSAAIMNVDGINLLDRPYSLTDYDSDLRNMLININTQGEINYEDGRLGYTWIGGSPNDKSQILRLSLLWGQAVLGDYKFSVLGMPENVIPNLQMVSEFIVKNNTTLYITENYKDSRYIKPDLYLGLIIGNSKSSATCIVEGNIIADGINSTITIDRGARLYIRPGATIQLKNKAIMRSTYNDENTPVLFIDGTLIIDDISQINMFYSGNIVFGETGKLVVLNPDNGEKRILWNTPNGIESSDLYRLFKNRIDHIEYHIQNNTGIGIDKNFEFYAREFTKWYGDRRIEKAIHDGILVWHDGGFIEVYSNITPWVNEKCTLFDAAKFFKSFSSTDEDRLQEVVDRLKYAGCGNILFRFVNSGKVGEVTMVLDEVNMKNVLTNSINNTYILTTDNDGELFLRNKISDTRVENIINTESKYFTIKDNNIELSLE